MAKAFFHALFYLGRFMQSAGYWLSWPGRKIQRGGENIENALYRIRRRAFIRAKAQARENLLT